MSEITKEELQELRRLKERATPGPWKQLNGWTFDANNEFLQTGYESQLSDADSAYIAYANPERIGRLLDAVEESRWIPVSERLPEKKEGIEEYLITYFNKGHGPHSGSAYWLDGRWWDEPLDADLDHLKITHWRPLPTPPASEEKGAAHE